jgi:beta-galactosidase
MLPMNRGWLYSHTAEDGATGREFNEAHFEHVVVPHTNVRLPWHGFTEHDYTFVSTYRRHFKLPESAMGRRVFVDFEGVMTASTVWLNGHKLGEYKGGYTPFSFELTPPSARTFRPSATKLTISPSAASIARSRCASCRRPFWRTSSRRRRM